MVERLPPGEMAVPMPMDQFRADGSEVGTSTEDFWRWMMTDLRMNTTRAFLGEFLVTRALKNQEPFRVEWASFDVEAATGTKVEVKTAGLAQSWASKSHSASFQFKSVDKSRMWDDQAGDDMDVDPDTRVHVWVFALNTIEQSETYDPLDLDRWEFRAVPHIWLRRCGQRSGSPSFFDKNGFNPVGFLQISDSVEAARAEHERLLEI